ncbi:histidine kinase N-terminal 7TM domain-containing protein [Halorientalis brevis]|uniref:histidine kinase n=1 Tax=Halorientalis brevis TaxID=1126241 RepID=A0ABD6CAP8_9EURY|nr:histidine kinase N-terminal 7TM domain-containing protein [Halorientalis brevis]
MDSFQTLLIIAYIACGLLPLILVRPVLRNRDNPGAVGMGIVIAGLSLWGLASAAHTAVTTQGLAFITWNVLLLGASFSIIGWFLVLSVYTGLLTPTRRVLGLLALEPLLFQLFVWTNPAHHLVYGQGTSFTAVTSIVSNYQAIFWVHAVVGYVFNLVAALLVLSEVLSARGVRRTQSIALFASLIPPTIFNVVHIVAETPFDLTPFGYVATVFILGWALFRAQLLDIVPIGRARAVENMSDAVVTVDTNGRVVDCNPAAREMVDVGPNYVGISGEEFFSAFPDAVDRFQDRDVVDTEISVTQDGTVRYFDISISPIHDLAGKQEGRLIVLREITLLKKREQELREREQELDLLRQVLSRVLRHNIRNDLTVVKGYNELLAADLAGEQQAMAEKVISKADDLVAISEKARSIEKLIQKDQQPMTIDLSQILTETFNEYRTQFPTVSFTLDCPENCTAVVTPSIELAVKNLLGNAAKHNDSAAPEVDVRLTERDETVRLTISDNGPGVPAQELRVLEQGEETPLEHGSGIGLWIVHWVISNSNASIDFDVDDDGTTAVLTVPA